MAIKAGQILHVSGSAGQAGFVIDRIQTGGLTGINVNETKINELGNYETVGTVRDIPDLTFELQSFDVTTELESILVGGDNSEADGTKFDLSSFVPLDILSPFKNSNLYTVAAGVVVPFLSLESMAYSFSLTDSASMTATLRGDSYFIIPGSPYRQVFDGDGTAGPFNFTNTALKSTISGSDYYALSVMVKDSDGVWQRQRLGTDFTNTSGGVTFLVDHYPETATGNIAVVYGSTVQASYLQTVHDATKPAGVRGRDIYVRLSGGEATPVYTTWVGVQAAAVNWRVTLDRDEEFGNPQVVAQDFDVPEVDGSVTMKASTVNALVSQIQAVAALGATEIANATQDPPELDLEIKLTDPADGSTMKTLVIPDAKFTMPQLQGNVGQKLETEFPFASSTGVLNIYKGDPA